jgi:ubiquitin carboxyl-terminal hydrolase L3
MKQTIGNACGTIALLHSIGNVRDKVSLGEACSCCATSAHLARAAAPQLTAHLLHLHLPAEPGSFLQQFYEATSGMDPAARGKYLEEPPEGAPDIEAAHQVGAAGAGS